MQNLGFIGLGNMGSKMITNLLKNNQKVSVYDINKKILDTLSNSNIVKIKSLNAVPTNLNVIITMLPDGGVVEEVLSNILPNIEKGSIIIDCSTIDVNQAKHLHKLCSEKNISFLDAPVSGGTIGAQNGSLTFMVGGEKEIFEKVSPLLKFMGSKLIYCGESGSGQATKLCNNLLLATTMIGVSESFNMAKKLNLNLNTLFEVISSATGSCWSVNNYCPIEDVGPLSPADNDFEPGFSAKLMSKDLKLAVKAAKDSKSNIKFGVMAENLYTKMANGKNGDKDFSGIIKEI